MDKKNGISERFLSYIKSLDNTLGSKVAGPETTLSEKAINTTKSLNTKHGITTRANTYYEKAFTSPVGQKVCKPFWSRLSLARTLITCVLGVCFLLVDEQAGVRHPRGSSPYQGVAQGFCRYGCPCRRSCGRGRQGHRPVDASLHSSLKNLMYTITIGPSSLLHPSHLACRLQV